MKKLFSAFICSVVLLFSLSISIVNAQTGDCDDNAVIRCGAFTTSALQNSMTGDVPAIFAHYGINQNDFSSLSTGTVRRDGTVWVNGRMVANQAVSVGRQDMPGSTHVPSLGIYERPPSVSFASNELTAFVKMNNGQFVYAIIQSCGNPVKATPVAPPAMPPPAQPVAQNPSIMISKSVSKSLVQMNEQFTYTVTVRNTGTSALTNAVVTDTPPASIQLIPGSVTSTSTGTSTTGTTNNKGGTVNNTNVTTVSTNTGTSSTTTNTANNTGTTTGLTQSRFTTTIASLPVGAVRTFTFNARVIQQSQKQLINTVCVNVPEITGDRDACASAAVQLSPVAATAITTTPTPAPIVTAGAPVSTPEPGKGQLPVTGAGSVLGFTASTAIASYAGSLFYTRLRNRFLG